MRYRVTAYRHATIQRRGEIEPVGRKEDGDIETVAEAQVRNRFGTESGRKAGWEGTRRPADGTRAAAKRASVGQNAMSGQAPSTGSMPERLGSVRQDTQAPPTADRQGFGCRMAGRRKFRPCGCSSGAMCPDTLASVAHIAWRSPVRPIPMTSPAPWKKTRLPNSGTFCTVSLSPPRPNPWTGAGRRGLRDETGNLKAAGRIWLTQRRKAAKRLARQDNRICRMGRVGAHPVHPPSSAGPRPHRHTATRPHCPWRAAVEMTRLRPLAPRLFVWLAGGLRGLALGGGSG